MCVRPYNSFVGNQVLHGLDGYIYIFFFFYEVDFCVTIFYVYCIYCGLY